MTAAGRWTRVFVDEARCLVYGPRLGRLYLLSGGEALEPALQTVLGLRTLALCETLTDPASHIVHDAASLRDAPTIQPSWRLVLAYRLLHWSRSVLPLRWACAIVCASARRAQRAGASASDIGRIVHGIERAAGLSDCYPRALLTAYLCIRHRRSCELAIGSLAPTRKMHAWCCTDGSIPYESTPEHHMYQPLLLIALAS